jgi:hypothetical protein
MVEFDVPTEEELKEMEAEQSLMGSSEEDIWTSTPKKPASEDKTRAATLCNRKHSGTKSYMKYVAKRDINSSKAPY